MIPGAHGLIGAMVGGGTAYAVTDDPNDATQNTMLGASAGSALLQMPKPAIVWAGKNMRNFSAGYYDQDPIKDLTKFENRIGDNRAISIKRNFESAGKTLGQKYGLNTQNLNTIKNSTLLQANKIYSKLKNPSQFEDLQIEMKRQGKSGDSRKYFNNYRKTAGISSTPEEALQYLRREGAELNNNYIDNKRMNLKGSNLQLDSALRDKAISLDEHTRRVSLNALEDKQLQRNYARLGEVDRKWRHEIAKNEIHHLWSNGRYNVQRLNQAGYNYAGQYRWGDVKNYMRSVGALQWEKDLNSLSNKLTNAIGLGDKNLMLKDMTPVTVLNNINVQDNKIKRKPSRIFQRMGREASMYAFNNEIGNKQEIKDFLINRVKNNQNLYNFTIRDIRDYGENAGATYKKRLNKYLRMNGAQKKSEAGQKLFNQLRIEYGKSEAGKIATQMSKQGGLNQATRGRFTLSGIGRVTNSYLEGGINATSEFRPFIAGNRQTKIAMRMITSDLSDLPYSGHTGYQNRIPFIIEEEFKTFDGKRGVDTYRNSITRDNPFYKDIKEWDKLTDPETGKMLSRTKVRNQIAKDGYSRGTMRLMKREIQKNPKRFIRRNLRRLPKFMSNPYLTGAVGAGLLAMSILGMREGEAELESIE